MIAISLQSGSSGNCIYVEAGDIKLLFDAGITGVQAEERLALHGRDIRTVNGLIISHDHSDHVSHAGVYQRKYGIPLYITSRTLAAASSRCSLGKLNEVRHFRSSSLMHFGDVTVQAFPTPHDGEDGAVFIVSTDSKRLGIMTDLGHVFKDLVQLVATLDGVFIESNYDPDLLTHGPYPAYLKHRIRGPRGHISNHEAAELLRRASAAGRLKWACLAHLSEQNNDPALALRTHKTIVPSHVTLHTASRSKASGLFTV